MFSSCFTDKKFISFLALSHVFLFFIRKYVIFLLLATLLTAQPKVQRLSKKCMSPETQPLHKVFPKDPKGLTFQNKQTNKHIIAVYDSLLSEPKVHFPQFYA